MKFAHLADCHIGGWREEKLKELGIESFRNTINICIKENVGFVIISGDLFNTSLPSIETLKEVASILEKLRSRDIAVYLVPGSHDFSASGKTMLDVLEKAGLCKNVVTIEELDDKIRLKFSIDDKTDVKLAGLFGKKGSLEKSYYEILDKKNLELEEGFKIFVFHTGLTEFMPKDLEEVESQSISLLPKNFDYYAGGHIHYIFNKKVEDFGLIAFPGPLFPNNFKELEELKNGGFYIVNDKLEIKYVPIKLKEVLSFKFNADDKTPGELEKEILSSIKDFQDKIITLRVEGVLKSGKPNDVNFREILSRLEESFVVLKNTNKLTTKEFEALEVETGNIEEIENKIIKSHLSQIKVKDLTEDKEEKLVHDLLEQLSLEKDENEKNADFEDRLTDSIIKSLNLKEIWEK